MVLYIFTVYDFIDKINNLKKNQKIVLGLIVVIFVLLISTSILKNNLKNQNNPWSYKEAAKFETINANIVHTNTINDRVKYWEMYSIIDKYINTIINKEEYSVDEYYEILTKEYKRKITKNEFKIKLNEFFNMFVYQTNSGQYNKVDYIIDNIYLYDNNMYLCHILVNTEEMSEIDRNLYYNNDSEDVVTERKTEGYIGIKLNEVSSTYTIFYIE